jgi:hypothetical protein
MDIVVGGKTISHQDILGTTIIKKRAENYLACMAKKVGSEMNTVNNLPSINL